jgi:hypothetical protein
MAAKEDGLAPLTAVILAENVTKLVIAACSSFDFCFIIDCSDI